MVTFPISIAPGQSVQVPFSFTPTAEGARSGNALVYSNAPGSPAVCALTGTGDPIPPGPPGSMVQYYASLAGGTSANITVTMPNGSPGDLLVAVLSGDNSDAITAPVGWNVVENYIGDGVTDAFLFVAWKIRGASEPSAVFTRTTNSEMAWACHNFIVTGRPAMTVFDGSVGATASTPAASYSVPGLATSKPNTLLMFFTAARVVDTNLLSYSGPINPPPLLPSPGFVTAGPTTIGTFDYTMWGQSFGAYNTGGPFIVRTFVGFWSGEGFTGPISYISPVGSVESRSFLLVFREPD